MVDKIGKGVPFWKGLSGKQQNIFDKIEDKILLMLKKDDKAKRTIYEVIKSRADKAALVANIPSTFRLTYDVIKDLSADTIDEAARLGVINRETATFVNDVAFVRRQKTLSAGQQTWMSSAIESLRATRTSRPEFYKKIYDQFEDAKRQAAEKEMQRTAAAKALLDAQANENWNLPAGINKDALTGGDLWSYQKKGANWMEAAQRGLLGFDTGLGKTLISIAFTKKMLEEKKAKQMVIVAPTSLLSATWEDEFNKWSKDTKVLLYHGPKRSKITDEQIRDADVIITGYNSLINDADLAKIKAVAEQNGNGIIFDEATRLKNRSTQRSKGAAEINSKIKMLLSATPIPNNPQDMFGLMGQIDPSVLGSFAQFKEQHCSTKEVWNGQKYIDVISGYKDLKGLREKVKSRVFMKYRQDPDVTISMPQYTAVTPRLSPGPGYTAVIKQVTKEMKQDGDRIPQARMLELITRMRMASVHPGLVDEKYKDKGSSKFDHCKEFLNDHFTNDPDHGVVLFCEFKSALDLMHSQLTAEATAGLQPADIGMITGDVSADKRKQMVDDMNMGKIKLLMITTKAGGEGLNLQKNANTVYHLNTPWSPADLKQADDRVNRQGQTNPVLSMRPILSGTFDEQIEARLQEKEGYSEDILDAARRSLGLATDSPRPRPKKGDA